MSSYLIFNGDKRLAHPSQNNSKQILKAALLDGQAFSVFTHRRLRQAWNFSQAFRYTQARRSFQQQRA